MGSKHEPTKETIAEVSALNSYGVTQEEIAKYIGVDPKTLRLHYRSELDTSKIKANSKVARRLFEHATGDSIPAAIFWMKAQAGWREKTEIDHTSSDGSMTPKPTLSKEEALEVLSVLNKKGSDEVAT